MDSVLLTELERAFGYPGNEVDYLCNIGMARAFLYYETPKVACSSIKRTLQSLEQTGEIGPPDDVHDKARSTLKGPLSSGWTFEQIFLSARLFRFTFVRNPYARALSCYLEKIVADEWERGRHQQWLGFTQKEPVTFHEFLQGVDRIEEHDRDIHWRSQAGLINDRHIHYHYIGRFENLHRDFSHVLAQLGIQGEGGLIQDISHHKTNAASRLREFYGPSEMVLAQKIYRLDFLRYGYPFDLPDR
jgi:Sulfotransferase family